MGRRNRPINICGHELNFYIFYYRFFASTIYNHAPVLEPTHKEQWPFQFYIGPSFRSVQCIRDQPLRVQKASNKKTEIRFRIELTSCGNADNVIQHQYHSCRDKQQVVPKIVLYSSSKMKIPFLTPAPCDKVHFK